MTKKKSQKTNAMRLIEQAKIPYHEAAYPWQEGQIDAGSTADKLGVSPGLIFKTLVTLGNKTGPIVAVIPGNQELNLKALAVASGNKKIEMLAMKELEGLTGYIRGGCSPIGMKKLFPTYIAQEAQELEEIYVSAGKRGCQVRLAPENLAALTKARFADIIMLAETGLG